MQNINNLFSIIFQIAPVGFVETPEFANLGFLKKTLFFSLWVKIILAKYISAWLLSEGAVILSGR